MPNRCACGCGARVKSGSTWLRGHQNKGKSYEEIYGSEKAVELRNNIVDSNLRRKGLPTKAKGVPRPKMSEIKKVWWAGKTPEERHVLASSWQQAGVLASKNSNWWQNLSEEQQSIQLTKLNKGRRKNKRTRIELLVQDILTELEIPFVSQYPISRYALDFYLPEYEMAIECDGEYWHSRPEVRYRDIVRDRSLLEDRGIDTLRLSEGLINLDVRSAILTGLMNKTAWMS